MHHKTVFATILFAGLCSAGTITQVTTRAGLGGNDYVPWSVLGADQKTYPASFTEATNFAGATVTISDTNLSAVNPNVFEHFIMGTDWAGNLNEYPNVLFLGTPSPGAADASGGLGPANGANDPITFSFAAPTEAVGMQIQSNLYGAFVATITAYSGISGTGSNYGTVTVNGISDSGATKAVFLGLSSSAFDIGSVVVNVTSNDGAGFGVNRLELVTAPEPGTLAGLGMGLALLGLRRRFSNQ